MIRIFFARLHMYLLNWVDFKRNFMKTLINIDKY